MSRRNINASDFTSVQIEESGPYHINGNTNQIVYSCCSELDVNIAGNGNIIRFQSCEGRINIKGNGNNISFKNSIFALRINGNCNELEQIQSQLFLEQRNGYGNNIPSSENKVQNNDDDLFQHFQKIVKIQEEKKQPVVQYPNKNKKPQVPNISKEKNQKKNIVYQKKEARNVRPFLKKNDGIKRNISKPKNIPQSKKNLPNHPYNPPYKNHHNIDQRNIVNRKHNDYDAQLNHVHQHIVNNNNANIQRIRIKSEQSDEEGGLTEQQINKMPQSKGQYGMGQCSICLLNMDGDDDVIYLLCLHSFHLNCCQGWLRKVVKCPICKVNMRKQLKKQNQFAIQ